MKAEHHHEKIFEKEYDVSFNVYRNIGEEEKEAYINKKLADLPSLHQKLNRFDLRYLLMDFGATNFYRSAMWVEHSLHPEIETCYAYSPVMNDLLVDKFNSGNFNQRSAIVKVFYYNSKHIVFQNLFCSEIEFKI